MYPMTLGGIAIFAFGFLGVLSHFTDKSSKKKSSPFYWREKAISAAANPKLLNDISPIDSAELYISKTEEIFNRHTVPLKFLAQISTLMGFLGTVTGMIKVFNTVASLGTVTPGDLASGIHEALFTTAYGLILALIAYFFIYIIEHLTSLSIAHLEEEVIETLEKQEA